MKYVFIEKHREEFSIKASVGCCAWPAVAGIHGVFVAISLIGGSSSVWSVMRMSGRLSGMQNSGMVHRDWRMNFRNTT